MKLNQFNLRSFFTKPIQNISRNIFSLQKCFPFCSTIDNPRKSSHFFNDVVPGTSAVYSHALKFQRPATIKWKPHLENNASFIGSVEGELKRMISKTGYLESYIGERELCYKLNVKQLNFVAQKLGYEDHEKEKKIEAGGQSGENRLNSIDRLHLWQVFFANPNEWWDQRKRKKNPNQPDFKHKDTGEALWLKKDDPPWVTRQLELLDSNIAEGGFAGRRSRVAAWVYDD
ncbi:protein OSB1, mitochondrial [Trifolium repens]|nr:protein OSB1, mitochondrial [Trifolium repens]